MRIPSKKNREKKNCSFLHMIENFHEFHRNISKKRTFCQKMAGIKHEYVRLAKKKKKTDKGSREEALISLRDRVLLFSHCIIIFLIAAILKQDNG